MNENHAAPNGTETGKPEERTFTQSELDAIIADRVKREREKYTDYADLKKKAEAYAAYEEAQKTELQKAQEAAQQFQAERDAALSVANDRMIRAEFIKEASRLNVAHPEDAYALADRGEVTIAEDGKVAGVADAVKVLVDAGRLPLSSRGPAPSLNGGAGSGERDAARSLELSEEQRKTALKLGLKPEEYAKRLATRS